ncbi:MBOAT family O-acyltransferase [Actibacterium ureilyticum]|uniref:MBOAT family O-acyltransferase n=1 Tax=Actibacterium ureilyticum TaxID=1590614 RepID=UPI000BAADD05|nr:MBOAT family O-acyltransferase [Actibacterium ureilyticum]
MILGLELTFVFLLALAAMFRLLFPRLPRVAMVVLIATNLALLAVLNAVTALYLTAQVVFVMILYAICRRFPAHANRISWFAFLGLIPFNLHMWVGKFVDPSPIWAELGAASNARVVWVVGSAFFVVKSFVCLRECLREKALQPLPILAGLTFLPSFAAGPIFGLAPFKPDNIAQRLDMRELARAVMMLGWGLASFYVIAPEFRDMADRVNPGVVDPVFDMYAKLAALYFDFSGYSLLAIAFGAFFGATLPQNFNKPYLATSIREFWQRWHMSLGWFVSMYLFKPFVRVTGSPRKGIFLAFVLVGLWHEVMPGYFLWGLGHGYALSLAMKPPAWWQRAMARLPRRVVKLIGWWLTMTWVALLSDLA